MAPRGPLPRRRRGGRESTSARWQPRQAAITLADVTERIILPAGVVALDMNPDSIWVDVDSLGPPLTPVVLDHSVSFRDRYGPVGPTRVTPDSVTVEGARSVIALVDRWRTARFTLDNLKAPVDMTVPMSVSDRYPLAVTPPEVRVQMDVQW